MITKIFKSKVLILILILFLASVLRLVNLSQYPTGLNADEASIGYNAYSLIQTGKDEHGDPWPIHFKSFGDYKPGLYFYLVLPFVRILGLNVLAVRLPTAFLGILSVWLIYLLVKELFSSKGRQASGGENEAWGLLSAFFLAISPWHLHFSRGGWEANAATFFILLGTWLFFKGFKKPKFYPLSVFIYILSFYTYHSARIAVPLLGLGLVFLYQSKLFNRTNRRWLLISGILGVVVMIPLLISFFGPAGVSRFSGVGLLADIGPLWRINELRGHHSNTMALSVRLIHNRFIGYSIAFIKNWFDHFQGEFLFITGDVIERSRVPETGQMYLFDIPLVVLGIYFLVKKRPKNWQVIFLWLVVAPVAAAMTFQTPHALRAHNMTIPLLIISAYGFYHLLVWVKQKIAKKGMLIIFYLLLSGIIVWNFSYFLHQYFVHYPKTYPEAWEYGFSELVSYLSEVEDNYTKIYVTERYDQPYIIFLFYLAYPPEKFQKDVVLTPRDKFGFSTVRDFDKFHFENIVWDELKDKKNILIVGTDEEIPDSATIIKTIFFKNNQPAFRIAET